MVEGTREGDTDPLVGPSRPKEAPGGEFPGPVRRLFFRREGLFEYISPGLLASSIISFGSFGIILGFGGVLVGDSYKTGLMRRMLSPGQKASTENEYASPED